MGNTLTQTNWLIEDWISHFQFVHFLVMPSISNEQDIDQVDILMDVKEWLSAKTRRYLINLFLGLEFSKFYFPVI